MEIMENKLKQLAQARAVYQAVKDAKDKALNEFWVLPENAALLIQESAARTGLDDAENQVRGDALELYLANGEKKHDGYQVKLFSVVAIPDAKRAFEWCLNHFTPALKLDTKVFEKAAKDGSVPDDLASVSEDPKVYIDGDLSRFLVEQGSADGSHL